MPGKETAAPRIAGRVAACLIADGADFRSREVEALNLDFAGIVGDFHAGLTRRSTSREPWYPRGTEVKNDRQISIVSLEELAEAAAAMDLPRIAPAWIGANLVLDGIPRLSRLPSGTKLLFAGSAALTVEAENGPCRVAGASIGEHFTAREGLDLLFPKLARHRRGLVASVERPGTIRQGEAVGVRLPAQWLYGVEAEQTGS
jgi:hypothetical protein